jgi:adenylate cyclase
MLAMRGALFDATLPTLSLLAAYATATLLSFARQHRREQRIRRRFEQHLSPHVVEMIARNPSILKLGGQSREVTAFFTDIADFTGMTHRATPEQLVASLDAYFEGVTRIVIAYGGMVDKFVGDAVHAFFNAPLDQAAHSEAAVRCAIAVHLWSEDYRREALPASLGFGHTRIGIETGRAIVGDVGVGAKLDYTAHGEAVNAAARLETANKELGTRICVGPGAASRCAPGMLRQSGVVTLRGFEGTTQTFEPAPELLEHQAPLAR